MFVVPHSHNDPGWKLTVEEYYDRQSRHILDTIVDTLLKDEKRKFIWEEMSYLERWWRDATDVKRESLIKLLQNGQLEIVGGGWVMNDEVKYRFNELIALFVFTCLCMLIGSYFDLLAPMVSNVLCKRSLINNNCSLLV